MRSAGLTAAVVSVIVPPDEKVLIAEKVRSTTPELQSRMEAWVNQVPTSFPDSELSSDARAGVSESVAASTRAEGRSADKLQVSFSLVISSGCEILPGLPGVIESFPNGR